jgi:hypothetical protein
MLRVLYHRETYTICDSLPFSRKLRCYHSYYRLRGYDAGHTVAPHIALPTPLARSMRRVQTAVIVTTSCGNQQSHPACDKAKSRYPTLYQTKPV